MCLTKLGRCKSKFKKVPGEGDTYYGYKVFNIRGTTLRSVFMNDKIRHRNKWLVAMAAKCETTKTDKPYTAGFHVMATEAGAKMYHRWEDQIICKVKFREITVTGYQRDYIKSVDHPCAVAAEMWICA